MATMNTANLIVIRELLDRAARASEEPRLDIRLTRLSQAFQLSAGQPIFNLVVMFQIMEADIGKKLVEIRTESERLSAVAAKLEASVDRAEEQRAAFFSTDRIRSLLKQYWHWLVALALFCGELGVMIGMWIGRGA